MMRSSDLVRAPLRRVEITGGEIADRMSVILAPQSGSGGGVQAAFIISLLLSLDDLDSDGRVALTCLFRRLAQIYWDLVVNHGLRTAASGPLAQAEEILLATFGHAGGARSLDSLPALIRRRTERAVARVCKGRVVGRVYGLGHGRLYGFDLLTGRLQLNPGFVSYLEAHFDQTLHRAIGCLALPLRENNRLDVDELRALVQCAALGRYDADLRGEDHPRTAVQLGSNSPVLSCRARLNPSERRIPARLAEITLDALMSAKTTGRLKEHGFIKVADLIGWSAEQLMRSVPLGPQLATRVVETIRDVESGALDPSVSIARSMEDELLQILRSAGVADAARLAQILELTNGFKGGQPWTLESVGEALGVTRERTRQLRVRADSGAEDVLAWFQSRVLTSARSSLIAYGGILRLQDLGALVVQDIAPGQYEPVSFLRWMIERAQDPAIQLFQDDLVVGPPVGLTCVEDAIEMIRVCLAEASLVPISALFQRLEKLWPELTPKVVMRHAVLLAQRVAVEVLPGRFARSVWHKADWAELALRRAERPLHYSEIAEHVNELAGTEYLPVSFNGILNSDPRFVRVGAGDFALAVWGARRYGRFDEVIIDYLSSCTILQHETEISAELLQVYTVAESTIAAMLRFAGESLVHYGGGFWGVNDRTYICDQALETAIMSELDAANSSLTLEELMTSLQGRGLHASEMEVERCLYTSRLFHRRGTTAPARFALRKTGTAATDAKGINGLGQGAVTEDEFLTALRWSI
jgi:hypothetical protein